MNKKVFISSVVVFVLVFGVIFSYKILLASKDVENFHIKTIKFDKSFFVAESLPKYSSRTFEINIGYTICFIFTIAKTAVKYL